MKTNLYILMAFLMEIGMLVGCSADGIPEKRDEVLPDGLTYIRFGVEAASGQGVDENTLQNLTVLQFDLDESVADVTEQDKAPCVTARYLRNPEPETDADGGAKGYYLIGLKASEKATQYLVFIANAGSMFQDYKGTLDDFKALTIPFDQKTNNGENQPKITAHIKLPNSNFFTKHSSFITYFDIINQTIYRYLFINKLLFMISIPIEFEF